MADHSNQPERPRVEPEIIPPGRTSPDWRGSAWRPDAFGRPYGTQRIHVTRVGPFGIALLFLLAAGMLGVIFFAVLGAILLWIPVVALLVVLGAILRFWRR